LGAAVNRFVINSPAFPTFFLTCLFACLLLVLSANA
jgi:hypothetical protein